MKKLLVLPFAAVVAFAACGEQEPFGPERPQFELVNEDERIAAADVNAHVYGSFALQFTETVGAPASWGVIRSGPANFPGNPKNAGTCDNGLWINAQGKRTSGSMDRPHPHCVGEIEGDEQQVTVHVVLEPISAQYRTFGSAGKELRLGKEGSDWLSASLTGGGDHSRGEGIVVAYAIDASTLGTTNRRVGTLTFNLDQYHKNNIDYFETDCTVGEDETAPRCLDLLITATYAPLAVGGVGQATEEGGSVTGFLYWSPATAPFNYGSQD
jgi:hypothetical protein